MDVTRLHHHQVTDNAGASPWSQRHLEPCANYDPLSLFKHYTTSEENSGRDEAAAA